MTVDRSSYDYMYVIHRPYFSLSLSLHPGRAVAAARAPLRALGREAAALADTAAHALLLRDPAKAPPVVRVVV